MNLLVHSAYQVGVARNETQKLESRMILQLLKKSTDTMMKEMQPLVFEIGRFVLQDGLQTYIC